MRRISSFPPEVSPPLVWLGVRRLFPCFLPEPLERCSLISKHQFILDFRCIHLDFHHVFSCLVVTFIFVMELMISFFNQCSFIFLCHHKTSFIYHLADIFSPVCVPPYFFLFTHLMTLFSGPKILLNIFLSFFSSFSIFRFLFSIIHAEVWGVLLVHIFIFIDSIKIMMNLMIQLYLKDSFVFCRWETCHV